MTSALISVLLMVLSFVGHPSILCEIMVQSCPEVRRKALWGLAGGSTDATGHGCGALLPFPWGKISGTEGAESLIFLKSEIFVKM